MVRVNITTESKSLRVIEFRSSGVKRFKDSNSPTLKLPKLLNCLLIFSLCLCVSVVYCDLAVSGFAQEATKSAEELEKEKAANPYANDIGPDSIDISGYPQEQKDNQSLFTDRCSKCHTIARPINSQFSLADEWERYVKRMMRKPGCTIAPAEGKRIWQFLVYDSQQRKLGENQQKWDEHRKKLLEDFKQKYPARYKELYETQATQVTQ